MKSNIFSGAGQFLSAVTLALIAGGSLAVFPVSAQMVSSDDGPTTAVAEGTVTASGVLAEQVSFQYPATVSIAADKLIEDQIYTFTFQVENTSQDPLRLDVNLVGNPNMIWGVRRVQVVNPTQVIAPGAPGTVAITVRTNEDLGGQGGRDVSFDIDLVGTREAGPQTTFYDN